MQKELGDNASDEQVVDFIWKTLNKGQVIPVRAAFSFFFLRALSDCSLPVMIPLLTGLRPRRPPQAGPAFHGAAAVWCPAPGNGQRPGLQIRRPALPRRAGCPDRARQDQECVRVRCRALLKLPPLTWRPIFRPSAYFQTRTRTST
jgi:hypothetical protein